MSQPLEAPITPEEFVGWTEVKAFLDDAARRHAGALRSAKWREDNPSVNAEYLRWWRKENPDRMKAYNDAWVASDPEHAKALRKIWNRSYYLKRRERLERERAAAESTAKAKI